MAKTRRNVSADSPPRPIYEGIASTFQAVYFRAVDGAEPVREFIDGLDPKRRAALLRQLDRVLYRRSERLIVLLHAFPKTTGKLPPSEIKIAQKRWEDFRAGMDARPRKPPRAAGRDAP